MRELSLFTGGGGGLLASVLLGWQTIGAVEIDEWCCERVGQRRDEGHLGEWFPIWNMDIRDFNRRVAPSYRGMVDVVSAGPPCQPFSIAGKQRAADDERNMWPATMECIRIIEPRWVWIENVPGLLAGHGYFGTILGDLAESGYDARWRVLSAAEVGAPHKRDRLWIVAYNEQGTVLLLDKQQACAQRFAQGKRGKDWFELLVGIDGRLSGKWRSKRSGVDSESVMRGSDNGLDSGLDRLSAIGNGQVPAVAATAWRLLTEDM